MNKLSLVAALAVGGLLACATITSAQDAPKKKGPTVEQRVDRMNTALNLTADQKTKIAEIRNEFRPRIHEAGNRLRAEVREELEMILAVIKG